MTIRDRLLEALEAVHDPHVPVSLRRMGMLREVEIDDEGVARIQVCIPCMACPGAGMLRDRIREAAMSVDGITDAVVEEGWHLTWTPEMVEPEVRSLMRANGIQI